MKKIAVEKAYTRLADAKQHFRRLGRSNSYDEFRSAWSDFLMAANSIHSILETGARASPQSRPWFGGKKNECRTDPLLQYLHQARNAEEHGIEFALGYQPETLTAMEDGESFPVTPVSDGIWKVTGVQGRRPEFTMTPPKAVLVPVTDDRYGTVFHPPESHLGQPLTDDSPEACGRLWLEYLERLIGEARARVT